MNQDPTSFDVARSYRFCRRRDRHHDLNSANLIAILRLRSGLIASLHNLYYLSVITLAESRLVLTKRAILVFGKSC